MSKNSEKPKPEAEPVEVEEAIPEISAAELMAMARAERVVEAPKGRSSGKAKQRTWLAGKSCLVGHPPVDDLWYVALGELADASNELATDDNSAYRRKVIDVVAPLIHDTRKSVDIGFRTFIVRAEHLNEAGLKEMKVAKEFETFINTMRAELVAAKDSTTQ